MPTPLTNEEEARRARLVAKIKKWEQIEKTETDPKALAMAQEVIVQLRKLLEEGDQV